MTNIENQLVDVLIDLRDNHHVIGVKAEFEAEGTRLDEAIRLKEIVTKAGLELTIKIGGCEALRDMYDARLIGVNAIVAPMVETAYAMKKFINAMQLAFSEEEQGDVSFLMNTETITAYNNLDSMFAAPEAEFLDGIVLGRVDFTGSMGLGRDAINSEQMFSFADSMAKKCMEHNKKFIIGGGVAVEALPFFKRLPEKSIYKIETRKIIFDAQKAISDKNINEGLMKAVYFELLWLKSKREFYGRMYNEDNERLPMLEKRYNILKNELKK